jgi:hypothetical protein
VVHDRDGLAVAPPLPTLAAASRIDVLSQSNAAGQAWIG